jgi:hypothetical protein
MVFVCLFWYRELNYTVRRKHYHMMDKQNQKHMDRVRKMMIHNRIKHSRSSFFLIPRYSIDIMILIDFVPTSYGSPSILVDSSFLSSLLLDRGSSEY